MQNSFGSTLRLVFVSSLSAFLMGACSSEAENPSEPALATPSGNPDAPREDAVEQKDEGSVAVAADEDEATTLCGAKETPVFSCTVRGGKIASVCLAKGDDGEFAQYRFGRPDAAPELVWPTDGNGQIEWASVPYSGGGEAQLSFAIGDVRYVVYSKVVRTNFTAGEPNNPAMTDGVMVLRSNKVAASLACDGTALLPIDIDAAQAHLAEANDLFTYDTP